MTDYREFEDPSSPGRHARLAGSGEGGGLPASGPAPWSDGGSAGYGGATGAVSAAGGLAAGAMNAGSMPAQDGPGTRKLSVPKAWLFGLAGLLLILVGISVFSLVKLSSMQSSLSHAQQQIRSERSGLSAEQQQVSSDEQQLTSLQSTVNSLPSDPLSAYGSMVCSNGGVYDISTGQTITAYYPCTDKNPN
jgi:hypothetical protein